jgi:hypothetical protein
MARRSRRLVLIGRVVAAIVLAGLAVYLVRAGLDKADKLASSIGLLVAALALVAPYLVPASSDQPAPRNPTAVVEDTGDAKATAGGFASTGVVTTGEDDGPTQVRNTGDATADGPASVANTGKIHRPL